MKKNNILSVTSQNPKYPCAFHLQCGYSNWDHSHNVNHEIKIQYFYNVFFFILTNHNFSTIYAIYTDELSHWLSNRNTTIIIYDWSIIYSM